QYASVRGDTFYGTVNVDSGSPAIELTVTGNDQIHFNKNGNGEAHTFRDDSDVGFRLWDGLGNTGTLFEALPLTGGAGDIYIGDDNVVDRRLDLRSDEAGKYVRVGSYGSYSEIYSVGADNELSLRSQDSYITFWDNTAAEILRISDGNVGIGVRNLGPPATPEHIFQIQDPNASNEELFFNINRGGAFRAGQLTFGGTRWEDADVGDGSAAFNYNTKASGQYSFAGGNQTTASGIGALAFGNNTQATGDYSFAFGSGQANADMSVALGYLALAQHPGSFVWNGYVFPNTYTSHGDNTFNVKAPGGIYLDSPVNVGELYYGKPFYRKWTGSTNDPDWGFIITESPPTPGYTFHPIRIKLSGRSSSTWNTASVRMCWASGYQVCKEYSTTSTTEVSFLDYTFDMQDNFRGDVEGFSVLGDTTNAAYTTYGTLELWAYEVPDDTHLEAEPLIERDAQGNSNSTAWTTVSSIRPIYISGATNLGHMNFNDMVFSGLSSSNWNDAEFRYIINFHDGTTYTSDVYVTNSATLVDFATFNWPPHPNFNQGIASVDLQVKNENAAYNATARMVVNGWEWDP
ncbi:hypothetical protein ACFL04_05000, partial [Patescibacteria group bacterium]